MNGTKVEKLKNLVSLFVRIDTQQKTQIFGPYLWSLFVCMIYGFSFKAALLGKSVSLGKHYLDFPLFLVTGLFLIRLVLPSMKVFHNPFEALTTNDLLQWILVSPTSLWEFFLAGGLWKFWLAITEAVSILIFSKIFIGTPIRPFLNPSILIALVLMICAYAGIGMMLSASALTLKRGSFLFPLIHQCSLALGGAFFPVFLFPKPMFLLSQCLPMTNALQIMRLSLSGASFSEEMAAIGILAGMALLFLPVGFLCLKASIAWCRKNGKF